MAALAESEGNVVTIASISGSFAQPYNSMYCASKAGVLLAMRSLAIEFAKQRVRVNCVSPGGIETPMPHTAAKELPQDIDWNLLMKSQSAFPGFMPPDDVGDAVLFLASDAAKSITGSVSVPSMSNSSARGAGGMAPAGRSCRTFCAALPIFRRAFRADRANPEPWKTKVRELGS